MPCTFFYDTCHGGNAQKPPTVLMELAIAGAQVTAALPPEEIFYGTLPGETLPWHPTGSLVNPTNAQARAWFTTLALDIRCAFRRPPWPHQPAYRY